MCSWQLHPSVHRPMNSHCKVNSVIARNVHQNCGERTAASMASAFGLGKNHMLDYSLVFQVATGSPRKLAGPPKHAMQKKQKHIIAYWVLSIPYSGSNPKGVARRLESFLLMYLSLLHHLLKGTSMRSNSVSSDWMWKMSLHVQTINNPRPTL